jgi:hypothetical protein
VSFLHNLQAASPLGTALLLATVAGLTIPIGAYLATIERIRPRWLQDEFRHSVLAFGGGGIVFFLIGRAIARRGGAGAMRRRCFWTSFPKP